MLKSLEISKSGLMFLFCVVGLGHQLAWAKVPPVVRPRAADIPFVRLVSNWKWTKFPWTGSDAPFSKVSSQIDGETLTRRAKAGEDPYALLEIFRKDVSDHPGEAARVYKWAFAAQCVSKGAGREKMIPIWSLIFIHMHHQQCPHEYSAEEPWHSMGISGKYPKPPQSYTFDRMMFIAAVNGGVYDVDNVLILDDLAERIRNWRSGDKDVELLQVWMLQNTKSGFGDYKWPRVAVQRAQRLVNRYPKDKGMLLILGRSYHFAWDIWNPPPYADYAIVTYRKFLAVAPKSDSRRDYAVREIAKLELAKKTFSKYKSREEWLKAGQKRRVLSRSG